MYLANKNNKSDAQADNLHKQKGTILLVTSDHLLKECG